MREQIERCLASDGLVIVSSAGIVITLTGTDAECAVNAILSALLQIHRQRDLLYESVFADYVWEDVDWAWEVILNLRFRDLALRWKRGPIEPGPRYVPNPWEGH